jgi:hypothetical protein
VCVREGIAGVELFLAFKYWPTFDDSIIFGQFLTAPLFLAAFCWPLKLIPYFLRHGSAAKN